MPFFLSRIGGRVHVIGSSHRDSDVAKWLEAACYILAKHPDPALHHLVEEAVDNIRGAQKKDGYINTYYTVSPMLSERT